MSGLLQHAERSSFVQCNRESDLRKRIDRVKINSGDLCGIDVQSDVPNEVLAERRVLTDRDRHIKPFTPLDSIRSNDFRRVLGIERFAHLLELGGKLLCLSRPDRLRRQSTADERTQSETEHHDCPYEPLFMPSTHLDFPPVIDHVALFMTRSSGERRRP